MMRSDATRSAARNRFPAGCVTYLVILKVIYLKSKHS